MSWSHCHGSWLNSLDNEYAESSRTASHQSDRGEVQETARIARAACPVANEKNTSAKWDESDGCQPDRSARASGSIRAYHGCQTRCADCYNGSKKKSTATICTPCLASLIDQLAHLGRFGRIMDAKQGVQIVAVLFFFEPLLKL